MKRKLAASLGLVLFFSLSSQNIFAQTSNSNMSTSDHSNMSSGSMSTDTSRTSTGTGDSDVIRHSQSSTITSDCITVKKQGKICGSRATTWCNNNPTSRECRNFSSSTTDSRSTTDKTMDSSGSAPSSSSGTNSGSGY